MGGECPKCDIRNPYVNEQSAEGHPHPTIRMIDDEQWIREHAFNFTNDGRLVTRGDAQHAVPVRYAQHSEERVGSVEQKFAVLKAATAGEQFSCCDGWGSHDDKCSVKGTDSTSKHTAMIPHEFNDVDGQSIRNETLPNTGDLPDTYDTNELRKPRMAAGSNSGNDDARGAGDLWRETFYETQEAISPKAMMDGMEKDATEPVMTDPLPFPRPGDDSNPAAGTAEWYRMQDVRAKQPPRSLQANKTAQGSGNTTTTMQEQNVTDPMSPGKAQPMAVPEAIDQTAGPHSPDAPATAPRTPGIQPKIVNVPPGTEADEAMTMQSSAKTADLFDDGAESSIENDLPNMSPEAKAQWLEAHDWVKENDHHGATWWLGQQQWSKKDHEEDIPYQDTDTAIETELGLQDKEEEQHTMEGTCRECGDPLESVGGLYSTICPACYEQREVKTSADQPYATYDRLKKFHDDWGNKIFPEDPHEPGTCKDCGVALNNAEGEYCGACFAGHVNEDADEKFGAERVKLVCNECGKHFSVSPNAADPSCPKCGGVDWDVADDAQPKQGAGTVSPNLVQNMNARPQQQQQQTGPGGVSVALMPGQEQEGEEVPSGYGQDKPIKRSILPELTQADMLMRGSLDDLVTSEESKLASGDSLSKLAGHFYTTVEGKGKTKMEAQRNAVDDYLYENGRRHSVREILSPKFIRKEPPMGVTYVQNGVTHHDYTKPNTAAPEKDWVEVWEFELHTHA